MTNGERLLTGRDLRYADADIDTQPTDIVYTRRGIPNGGIYQASDPSVCRISIKLDTTIYIARAIFFKPSLSNSRKI